MDNMEDQIGNFNKEIEFIRNNKIKMLKVKNK